jgi:formylglycine-generating enzyme required for sulfatase activity
MTCTDAGKRLCSSEEWFSSCQGFSVTSFPYGEKYDKKSCPTEGKEIWKSGKFTKCNKTGVFDMLGNAWEWVENRNGDYPLMMGGSFRFGSNAQCKQSLEGSIASKSDETGFRCCK